MKVCQALAELGHTLNLWLPYAGEEMVWGTLADHYGITRSFPIKRLRTMPGLGRYDFCLRAVIQSRRWSADLCYVWPIQAAVFASWMGIPSLLEVHDRPRGRLGPWLFKTYLSSRTPRRILPISHALQAWLSSIYSADLMPPLSVVAPDGIDLQRYDDLPEAREARRRLGIPEGFTAVYTGHLYPGRGVELILDLARGNPSVNFVLAGGEPKAIEYWRNAVMGRKLENVRLLGFVPNARLPLVQAAGEVLLMPYGRAITVSGGGDTTAFASPMKMFEYLAAGRVILSSDLPVLREVLNEGNAILLPPEDPAAWRAALEEVRAAPDRAGRLAARARTDARLYGWVERARASLAGLETFDERTDV